MEPAPVILFDGECLLCHRAVRFVLRHDRAGRFRFAPLRSETGLKLLARHGLADPVPDSLVLIEDGAAHLESSGALRIARGLGGGWRLAGVLLAAPRALRDPVYRWVARNRFRWFGRTESCLVPDPAWRDRFLDG